MTPLSRTWHWWASCESVCCMRGKAWSSADWWRSWPMTNTLACLRSCQWWAFWTYLVTVNLFYLYLMNFMFHTTLDALGNILRVYYKSMKCDVLFSQGSISTLFRWVEHVFHVCIKCSSCLQQYKNYKKIKRVFTELWSQMYSHVLWITVYSVPTQETAKHRAKFGWPPLSDVSAVPVMKPRRDTRWNLLQCPKLANRSQPLVGRSSPCCEDVEEILLFNNFSDCRCYIPSLRRYSPTKLCDDAQMAFLHNFCVLFLASRVWHISDLHSKFVLRHIISTLRQQNIGEERRRTKTKETTAVTYNGPSPCRYLPSKRPFTGICSSKIGCYGNVS